jgi:hypothetical protein
MYGGLPEQNPMTGGFNPTQAPTVGGAPEQTTMGVQNLANAYGFGAASPIGGYSPMQFKGGASNPASMGSQQYSGTGYNPATFAGTQFSPQGGIFAGGVAPGSAAATSIQKTAGPLAPSQVMNRSAGEAYGIAQRRLSEAIAAGRMQQAQDAARGAQAMSQAKMMGNQISRMGSMIGSGGVYVPEFKPYGMNVGFQSGTASFL